MKNLLGVMILATLPVACGTTNPNSPVVPTTADAGDASFATSGRGSRNAPAACTPVTHVVVTVEEQLQGSAYLTVQAFGTNDRAGALCGGPTWSVSEGRQVQLTPSLTGNAAVLEGPPGSHVVTVSYPTLTRTAVSGSATVTFRR